MGDTDEELRSLSTCISAGIGGILVLVLVYIQEHSVLALLKVKD